MCNLVPCTCEVIVTPQPPKVVTVAPSTYNGVAYRHIQGISSAVWNIKHNLGFYPNVTVEDSAGTTIEGEIEYVDVNNVRLTFASPFGGYAYLS